MKLYRALIAWLLLASTSLAANVLFYVGPTGQTLYVRFQTGASTYVATALTEGSSGGLGNYTASEATIAALTGMGTSSAAAGFPNGHPFRVYSGTPSASAADTLLAYGNEPWSGSVEIAASALLLPVTNGAATVASQLAAASTGGELTDTDFEDVPTSRTFNLVTNSNDELVGDKTRVLNIASGEKCFAINYGTDLATNRKISVVGTPTIYSGTSGGVTFGDNGRDKNIAKIRVTGVTAGTYVIQVVSEYDGGSSSTAKVTIKVVE